MSISYCLNCDGTDHLPYAMCDSSPRFDLSLFAQSKQWLRVNYTFTSTSQAKSPVNLWFKAGSDQRKRLPIVEIGDLPGTYEKLLRVDEACFKPSTAYGSSCPGKGSPCAHCGDDEICGATADCGAYDLTHAWLQLAAEFCAGGGKQSGTVTLNKVELVQPLCGK
jgi:hypothetical protein